MGGGEKNQMEIMEADSARSEEEAVEPITWNLEAIESMKQQHKKDKLLLSISRF